MSSLCRRVGFETELLNHEELTFGDDSVQDGLQFRRADLHVLENILPHD